MKFGAQLYKLVLLGYLGVALCLRICGNYCGPDWCNGRVLAEQDCDVDDGSSVADPLYVADLCCREHDRCCGHGNRSTCNGALIQCIQGHRGLQENQDHWFLCGNDKWASGTIAEFFEAMGLLTGGSMCCGTLCE
jgi:hypothetical protein